jgi:hypothetical protein
MPESPFAQLSSNRNRAYWAKVHEESRAKLLKTQRESSTLRNLNRDEKLVKTGKREQIGREAKRELRGELEFHEAKERATASPAELEATRGAVREVQLGKSKIQPPTNPRMEEMKTRSTASPKQLAEMRDKTRVTTQRHQFPNLDRR